MLVGIVNQLLLSRQRGRPRRCRQSRLRHAIQNVFHLIFLVVVLPDFVKIKYMSSYFKHLHLKDTNEHNEVTRFKLDSMYTFSMSTFNSENHCLASLRCVTQATCRQASAINEGGYIRHTSVRRVSLTIRQATCNRLVSSGQKSFTNCISGL